MKLNIIKQRVLWWSISGMSFLIGIGAMALSWQQFGAPCGLGLTLRGNPLAIDPYLCPDNTCEDVLDVADIRQVLQTRG
jgi:preprotein translocase subunit SecF